MEKDFRTLVQNVTHILELWMEASLYLDGALEDRIPQLKRARTLTGLFLGEQEAHEAETD